MLKLFLPFMPKTGVLPLVGEIRGSERWGSEVEGPEGSHEKGGVRGPDRR